MSPKTPIDELAAQARAAAQGDPSAARALLEALQDDIFALALRMLGHPQDAEEAAQEILLIVLTHLGSFRAESAFKTWVWRIAANYLVRARRGRREVMSFELLDQRLHTGLRAEVSEQPDPEEQALARELRLRCTEAMILSLERDLRIAYVLGDIVGLTGELAAEVLEIDAAAYRKRLSRARTRLHTFLRGWCGVLDAANPCRCRGQVACAVERGVLTPAELDLSSCCPRADAPTAAALDPLQLSRASDELTELERVAEVMRGPSSYRAPGSLVLGLRKLMRSQRLALLRD